jgi:hypothetical protein
VNGANHTIKTPSPETSPSYNREGATLQEQESPYGQQSAQGYGFSAEYQNSMNQVAPYNPADVHSSHMATTHAHPPASVPGAPMGSHYAYQNPMVQQGHPYSSSPASYAANYTYPSYSTAPVTSSMSNISAVSHVAQPPQLSSKL